MDRFQGHEADIVFLSFARNRGVGYLDCINRLNVAVTRARYQLVIIGCKANFADPNKPEILNLLADKTPLHMMYREVEA